MPEVQVQGVVRHAPMLTRQEHTRHVPRVPVQQVEKIVGDPFPRADRSTCRPLRRL